MLNSNTTLGFGFTLKSCHFVAIKFEYDFTSPEIEIAGFETIIKQVWHDEHKRGDVRLVKSSTKAYLG